MIVEPPTRTSWADWPKPETPLGVWMQSGGHHSTASRPSWSSTTAAYCQPFCMDHCAGRWQSMTLPSSTTAVIVNPSVWITELADDKVWPCKALPQLCIVHPSVWIRELADDKVWPCQALRHLCIVHPSVRISAGRWQSMTLPTVILSNDKPQENPMHLLAENHLKPWPLIMVPVRGSGEHYHQEAMALDWAHAAQGCQVHHQSCNPLDPRGKAEELWKRKWRRWTTPEAPSRGWPMTDRDGRASLLPYMPAGVTGSDK